MNEREGSERLTEIFRDAGCDIATNVPFALSAGVVHLDGWDEARRIGFELITTEAGDREEFTPAVVAELEDRMERGELYVFLVDEASLPHADSLDRAAARFLDHLKKLGVLR